MIFLLEGPDGSGKTTLANKLANTFGYKKLHFGAPKDTQEADTMFDTYDSILSKYNGLVIDRMWPSAQVYGPIFRGKSEITIEQAQTLERTYANKLIIIYCTGEPSLMWQRCQERGEDFVLDKDTYMRICNAYDDIMLHQSHAIPVHPWVLKGNI